MPAAPATLCRRASLNRAARGVRVKRKRAQRVSESMNRCLSNHSRVAIDVADELAAAGSSPHRDVSSIACQSANKGNQQQSPPSKGEPPLCQHQWRQQQTTIAKEYSQFSRFLGSWVGGVLVVCRSRWYGESSSTCSTQPDVAS
jgi:hypothetical protein